MKFHRNNKYLYWGGYCIFCWCRLYAVLFCNFSYGQSERRDQQVPVYFDAVDLWSGDGISVQPGC